MDRDMAAFNRGLEHHLDPDKHMQDDGELQIEMIMDTIMHERAYQDRMASKKGWQPNKSFAEWLLIMEQELSEAKLGYIKNGTGRDSAMHEILQVVAVGVAYLETLSQQDLEHLQFWSKIQSMEPAGHDWSGNTIKDGSGLRRCKKCGLIFNPDVMDTPCDGDGK